MKAFFASALAMLTGWLSPLPAIDLEPALCDAAGAVAYAALAKATPLPAPSPVRGSTSGPIPTSPQTAAPADDAATSAIALDKTPPATPPKLAPIAAPRIQAAPSPPYWYGGGGNSRRFFRRW
jgi:hypothetical protein